MTNFHNFRVAISNLFNGRIPTNLWVITSGTNLTAPGFISIQGMTNRIGDNNSGLTYNGTNVGAADSWEVVSGVFRPVDLTSQPLTGLGWFVGTNSPGVYTGSSVLTNAALISIKDVSNGDPNYNEIWIGAKNGGTEGIFHAYGTTSGFTSSVLDSAGGEATLSTANGNPQLSMKANGNFRVTIRPGIGDGFAPYILDTDAVHTSGNLLEVANVGTNKVAVAADGAAHDTTLLLWDVDSGALQRVSVGAADSGGTGFKLLRIPN